MSQSILKKLFFLSLPLLLLTGCHSLKYGKKCCKLWRSSAGHAAVKPVNKGDKLSGEVHFESLDKKKVQVKALVTGLKPNQNFGFHIHEFGDCGNKALQAGGHFNPWNHKHGGPEDVKKHLGDMGNLKSDKDGKAVYNVTLHGPLKAFLGRSVVIHEKADDLKSQPTGNSGGRIGCGIIGRVMSLGVSHKHDHKTHEKSHKTQPVKAKVAPKAAVKPAQKDKAGKKAKDAPKTPEKAASKTTPKTPAKAAVKPIQKDKAEEVKPTPKAPPVKATEKTKATPKKAPAKKEVKKPVPKTKVKAVGAKKTSATKKESVEVTTKVVVKKAETKNQTSPLKTEKATNKTAPKTEKASK